MKRKYIEAIAHHNLLKVRIMLVDELLLDPRGITYSEMLEYAKEKLSNLFEPSLDCNYEVPSDRNAWNIDLVSTIKQDLVANFSVEKLQLYKEVAMEVGKEKALTLEKEENNVETVSVRKSRANKLIANDSTPIRDRIKKERNKNKQSNTEERQENTQTRHSLGTIVLNFSKNELEKRLNFPCDYINYKTLDIKYGYKITEKHHIVDERYVIYKIDNWGSDLKKEREWVERLKTFKIVRIIFEGIENNIVKLKFSSKENILKSSRIKRLIKDQYITINEDSSIIYIDLCKIKYFADILSKGVVQSIYFTKNSIEMKIILQ